MRRDGSGGQYGAMNVEDEQDGVSAIRPTPRFMDELIRPFVFATITVITAIQLVQHPPGASALGWVLVGLAVVAGVVSSLPRIRVPDGVRIAAVVVFALASAVLFVLASGTTAVAFVFVAATVVGERLSQRQAFALAGLMTVVAAAVMWFSIAVRHVSDRTAWWVVLLVGLPVYIGIARREQADAVTAARLAAEQSRRAAASEAREAALEERGRIAREIHDVLGHALSGIAVQLDMADALHVSGRDGEANEAVRRARAMAVSGIGETRRAVQALREDTLPLPATIARLAESSDVACEVSGEPGAVRVEVAQAVIRAAQESITNAHRHAPGARVDLVLEFEPELVRLTVTDGGGTALPAAAGESSTGMGLVGMRERASLLGGTLHAGPVDPPGRGWCVRLELPR